MSHPDELPDLFLDRSLGRIKVPSLLRAAGLRLATLSEYYGIPADEAVADKEWLELAGRQGWVVFMKVNRPGFHRDSGRFKGHSNQVQPGRKGSSQEPSGSLLLFIESKSRW